MARHIPTGDIGQWTVHTEEIHAHPAANRIQDHPDEAQQAWLTARDEAITEQIRNIPPEWWPFTATYVGPEQQTLGNTDRDFRSNKIRILYEQQIRVGVPVTAEQLAKARELAAMLGEPAPEWPDWFIPTERPPEPRTSGLLS